MIREMRPALLLLTMLCAVVVPGALALRLPVDGGGYGPGRAEVQHLARRGLTIYCGGGRHRLVALTFDDGPGPWSLRLLARLRRSHARATFFVVGSRIDFWPMVVRAESRAGVVGDHTWTHARLSLLDDAAVRNEIVSTRTLGHARTGNRLLLFRPPYGVDTPGARVLLRRLGMLEVLWSVDGGDSLPGATPERTAARVVAGLRPGAIVLLHDTRPWTPWVAGRVLAAMRRRHLRAVTVPELLAADPPRIRNGRSDCR